jgi:hypothetical protein
MLLEVNPINMASQIINDQNPRNWIFFFCFSANHKIKMIVLKRSIINVQILMVKPEIFKLKTVSNDEVRKMTNRQASSMKRMFLEKNAALFDTINDLTH